MVKYQYALLETGCKTIAEFTESFYEKKPIQYTTKNIRAEFCAKCQSQSCDNCFVGDGIKEILKDNPCG